MRDVWHGDLADVRFSELLSEGDAKRVDKRPDAETPRRSEDWRLYFEANARTLLEIPWDVGPDLSVAEAKALRSSLQEFQAGKHSDGRHLHRFAQAYADATGDHDYVRAIRLFIAEEQRHARDLGRFLALNRIPLVRTAFADQVSRHLRNLAGSLEVSIAGLITAELIARVYYAALRDATRSQVLRRLCDQILRDERAHVQFQAGQLHTLRAGRPAAALAATRMAQRLLYLGTVLVVWVSHRQVIRRGGLAYRDWWTQCWCEFDRAFGATLSLPVRLSSGPAAR